MKNSERPSRVGGLRDRADQDLGHHPDQDAGDRQGDHGGADRPAPAVLVAVLGVEDVAVGLSEKNRPST